MKSIKLIFLATLIPFIGLAQDEIQVRKIWSTAPHNAFTDLVWFKDKFYCSFREGTGHIPEKDNSGDGQMRVISSKDGKTWKSVALLKKDHLDLRDPKLSITPDGRLMMIMGSTDYEGHEMQRRMPHVSFSDKSGAGFSEPIPINLSSKVKTNWDWLWRVTWHEGTGYGVIYELKELPDLGKKMEIRLVSTKNGMDYELVTELEVDGRPNESTVRVMPDGEMLIMVRREGCSEHGYLGRSKPPYTEWTWNDLEKKLGGPNFIGLPKGELIFGSRKYLKDGPKTALYLGDRNGNLKEIVEFTSGGDTSYPGLVWKDNKLYVSFYSSHEDKTSIYFAVILANYINGHKN